MNQDDDIELTNHLVGKILGLLLIAYLVVLGSWLSPPQAAANSNNPELAIEAPTAPPKPAYADYFMAGRALLAQGRVSEATQMLAADMAVNPNSLLSEIYLSTLIGQHCFDWDLPVLTKIRPILPGYVQLLECLGRRYEGSSDYQQAEGAYRDWAERHPGNAEPYARLGELFFFTKQYGQALEAFSLHREIVGDSHYAVRRMALAAVGQITPPYAWVASRWFRENRGHGDIWLPSHWRTAADQGDATATYNMGMLSLHGWGTTADPTAAMGWFRRAAAQGEPRARLHLACANLTGNGIPQNLTQGFRLTQQTARQGSAHAYLLLGSLYAYGLGTQTNKIAAMTAYNKAALQFAKTDDSGWLDVVLSAMRGVSPQHPFVIALSERMDQGQMASGEVAP